MQESKTKRWLRIYFLASLVFVFAVGVFAYGVAVGTYQVFPYHLLESTAEAVRDFARFPRHFARLKPEKWLAPAPDVVSGQTGNAYDGVTFIDGFFGMSTGFRLVDMDGTVIHEWVVPFSRVWPDPTHVPPVADWDVQIHGALLYPNGDVVFNFQYSGLARIDSCGNVLWRLPRETHHSVYADADGNLWVPSRRARHEASEKLPGIPAPFNEEYILQVSPQGDVLREISILDSIVASHREGILFANGAHTPVVEVPLDGDFTHLNDIEVLEAPLATAFPQFATGDLLISLRNLDLVLVLDGRTAAVKWSMVGPYLRQHDPDFAPNGSISVFDNRRDAAGGKTFGGSRILQIDPLTRKVEVRYGNDGDLPFYTATMGDHQYLPNGNLLITESEAGHAFEVAPSGEIVWSYVNRWDEESAALIGRAIRYPSRYGKSIGTEVCRNDNGQDDDD